MKEEDKKRKSNAYQSVLDLPLTRTQSHRLIPAHLLFLEYTDRLLCRPAQENLSLISVDNGSTASPLKKLIDGLDSKIEAPIW